MWYAYHYMYEDIGVLLTSTNVKQHTQWKGTNQLSITALSLYIPNVLDESQRQRD